MTGLHPFKAAASRDGSSVLMVRGAWRQTVPAAEIKGWVKFYSAMRDRERGRFAAFYAPAVEVLKGVEAKIRERAA